MMFVVTGAPLHSRIVRTVQWDQGRITGDSALVVMITARARALDGIDIGPPEGPYTLRNHLDDPLSALMIIRSFFSFRSMRVSGDIPTRPPISNDPVDADTPLRGDDPKALGSGS